MIRIKSVENKFAFVIILILLIVIIGFIDYKTESNISFSFFYLIPISIAAIYNKSDKTIIMIIVFVSSLAWLIADIKTNKYTSSGLPIWNGFVRFFIFTMIGLLIFKLKEKNKKLDQLIEELKNINKEKNNFIGIVSHDLRNPIGTIYSFSDIMITDYANKLSTEMFEIMERVRNLSYSTLELLKKILDVSKIEAGIFDINLTKQDYIKFIQNHVDFNRLLANKKEIKIRFETTEKEIIFNFDEEYISEVINNMLTNAIKFSFPKSEIIIKVTLTKNDKIKTEVIDKGEGIQKEEQYKLFKYFQKTSTKPTAGESSSGLGLAISKKIVIEHGGEIGVISEIDEGSNFYFELPK